MHLFQFRFRFRFLFLLFSSKFELSSAFLGDVPQLWTKHSDTSTPSPSLLTELQKIQEGHQLQIRLILQNPNDKSAQLALQGLDLGLTSDDFTENFKMPGDEEALSSGKKTLKVLKEPTFVSINGQEKVEITKGCWELNWRPDGLVGNLICGLMVSNEAKRNENGAKLPKGPLYLSFLVWSTDEWERHWQIMNHAKQRACVEYDSRIQTLKKYEECPPGINKVLLYKKTQEHQARLQEAWQEFQFRWTMTPNPNDVIKANSGIVLWTKGASWTDASKLSKDSKGNFWMKNLLKDVGEYRLLGKAQIMCSSNDAEKEK